MIIIGREATAETCLATFQEVVRVIAETNHTGIAPQLEEIIALVIGEATVVKGVVTAQRLTIAVGNIAQGTTIVITVHGIEEATVQEGTTVDPHLKTTLHQKEVMMVEALTTTTSELSH